MTSRSSNAGELKARSRATRPPPPPPPPRGGGAAAVSSSGFNKTSTATTETRGPRPRGRAQGTQQQASTSHAPYGNAYATPAAASQATASGGTSFYGVPAPAPAPFVPSAPSHNTSLSTSNNDGFYTPAPAAASAGNDGWYSAPATEQQPAAYNPSNFVAPPQQQDPSQLAGAMDGSNFFSSGTAGAMSSSPDFDNEPPLLEELGINMDHIMIKTRAVILPFSRFGHDEKAAMTDSDDDLAGPLVFCICLGAELLLVGKPYFGFIYGFGLCGVVAMTGLLNLLTPSDAVHIWTVTSILGYAMLPVNLLALLKVLVVNLFKMPNVGRILAVLTVAWCTIASTRLFEKKCDMRDQRYLMAYPIALVYTAFVMIAFF